MQPKFKILPEERKVLNNGASAFRIIALRSFGSVHEGDVGVYIENEENLSHRGYCWVGKDAVVSGSSRVLDNSLVTDQAWVSGFSQISGCAKVQGNASVRGTPKVTGRALIQGHASIRDDDEIMGGTVVEGSALVRGSSSLSYGLVQGNALIEKSSDVMFLAFNAGFSVELSAYRDIHQGIRISTPAFSGSPAHFKAYVLDTCGEKSPFIETFAAFLLMVESHFFTSCQNVAIFDLDPGGPTEIFKVRGRSRTFRCTVDQDPRT